MQALCVNLGAAPWQSSRGFLKQEVPTPELYEPEDAESVIVKLRYAGVCGSDRGIWFRESFKDMIEGSLDGARKRVRVIGHESFGEIVAAGSRVAVKFGFRIGDTVSAESHITCGACYQCRAGELHVCTEEKILGISVDGCFAEYVKLPAKVLWLTDTAKIRPEIACMQEPFGNAVHACTKVNLRGKSVAIFGCGPIGLFAVLVARSLGASLIICVEPNQKHADLARAFGADQVLSLSSYHDRGVKPAPSVTPSASGTASWNHNHEVVVAIKELTHGIGVDVALEMAGYNSSVSNAVQSVRRGGHVILFGLKSGDFTIGAFDRMIVRGVALHSVIGREIFKTWYTTRTLFEDNANGVQDKLWQMLLQEGCGTIVDFHTYTPKDFEARMATHPKIIVKF